MKRCLFLPFLLSAALCLSVGQARTLTRGGKGKHSGKKGGSGKVPRKPNKTKKPRSKGGKEQGHCTATASDFVDADSLRSILSDFVSSLNATQRAIAHSTDAAVQEDEWTPCTIVQQCLDPDSMLSLGLMPRLSRGLAYKALSKVMSQESYNLLLLQQHSNMLLGEMQDWGTTCEGTCQELNDPTGQLLPMIGSNPSTRLNRTYEKCAELRKQGRYTFWRCNEEPRMIHHADINTTSARYLLGNIFDEPHIHGRNARYDFFAVYGNVESGAGPFGMRFSGHHMDLNFQFDKHGKIVKDLPVFLGHNPLIVPSTPPPLTREHDEREEHEDFPFFLMWENMAGIAQFREGVDIILACANQLQSKRGSYVPLENFESKTAYGALVLKNELTISDFDHVDLSSVSEEEFDHIWSLIEYTLKFPRGMRLNDAERDLFREQGKAIWTTTSPPEEGLPISEEDMIGGLNFFFVQVETDDWLFFCMVNQQFTVISEKEATNHLHSILIEKRFL